MKRQGGQETAKTLGRLEQARGHVRDLAREHLERGDQRGWFERLYAGAGDDWSGIPWADLEPNPFLLSWLAEPESSTGGRAIVVGCGLGDDAEALVAAGFEVTAFDLAPAAIAACRRRFPGSVVDYQAADLLDLPAAWEGAFDFVFEAYTLQSVPPEERRRMLAPLAGLAAPGGRLLLVCRGHYEGTEAADGPPWPLAHEDLVPLLDDGLVEERFEDLADPAEPVRRFRMVFRKAL